MSKKSLDRVQSYVISPHASTPRSLLTPSPLPPSVCPCRRPPRPLTQYTVVAIFFSIVFLSFPPVHGGKKSQNYFFLSYSANLSL